MTAPECTLIIAVKNGEEHIATTFASLARQCEDAARLEIVVIDDGSTDSTSALVNEAAQTLPGIVLERWEVSRGVGSARVRGLELARGEWVGFIDADDWMAPGRVTTLVDTARGLDVDFVRTDHVRAEGAVRTIHRAPEGRRNVVLSPRDAVLPVAGSAMIDYPFPWAGIFHRRMVDSGALAYDDGLHTAEDRVAAWRFHLRADRFAVVSAPPIFYRRGVSTSLTQVYDRRQLDFVRGFRLMRDVVDADPEADVFLPKLVRQFFAIADHHVQRSAGMDAATRRDLRNLVRGFVAELPSDQVTEQWAHSTPSRRLRLAPYTGLDQGKGVHR